MHQKKNYFVTLIPALFMTTVCATFLLSEQTMKLDTAVTNIIATVSFVIALAWFVVWYNRYKKTTRRDMID